MPNHPIPREGQAIIYATADGAVRVEVMYHDETFWLTTRRSAGPEEPLAASFGPKSTAHTPHASTATPMAQRDRLTSAAGRAARSRSVAAARSKAFARSTAR